MTIAMGRFATEIDPHHVYIPTPWFKTFIGRLSGGGPLHMAWDGPEKVRRLREKQLARRQELKAELAA